MGRVMRGAAGEVAQGRNQSMPRYRGRRRNERLVVAVKLSETGGELVAWALTQAARTGDTLTIVHVTEPCPLSLIDVVPKEWKAHKQDMLDTLSALVSYCQTHYKAIPKLSISVQVVENASVGDGIVEEARKVKATLVLVGKSKSSRLQYQRRVMDLGSFCVRNLSPYCCIVVIKDGQIVVRRAGTARTRKSLDNFLRKHQQPDDETDDDDHEQQQRESGAHRVSGSGSRGFDGLDLDMELLDADVWDALESRTALSSPERLSKASSSSKISSSSTGRSSWASEVGSPTSVLDRFSKSLRRKSITSRITQLPLLERFLPEGGCLSESSARPSCSDSGNNSPPVSSEAESVKFTPRRSVSSSRSLDSLPEQQLESEDSQDQEDSSNGAVVNSFSPPQLARVFSEVRYRLTEDGLRALSEDVKTELPTIRRFSFGELRDATSDFGPQNLVGRGAASSVYKGKLRHGPLVAVKLLGESSAGDKEFMMEMMMLVCALRHPNLVTWVGFCSRGPRRLLVYEYLGRGSLEQHLHGKNPTLSWAQRQKVGLGASRGLAYLHNFSPRPIIHRDIKTSNILLADSFDAKVSDFGIARWLQAERRGAEDLVTCAGTFGYMAPECFMYANFDERTDVYAFGVVLLELISGRRPIDRSWSEEQQSLVQWARTLQKEGEMYRLVDPRLKDIDPQQFKRMMYTAFLCIQVYPEDRPTMASVVRLLDPQCKYSPPLLASPANTANSSESLDLVL